jgi:hypothetical protein
VKLGVSKEKQNGLRERLEDTIGSIKEREFLDKLSDYQFLSKDSAPLSY